MASDETQLTPTFIVQRESFDEELAAIPPEERAAYLKEYEDADKTGAHKQGGLIDKCMFFYLYFPCYFSLYYSPSDLPLRPFHCSSRCWWIRKMC